MGKQQGLRTWGFNLNSQGNAGTPAPSGYCSVASKKEVRLDDLRKDATKCYAKPHVRSKGKTVTIVANSS